MIGTPEECIRWLFDQDRQKMFEIKVHREKRSLDANAYLWVLIGKIADAVRANKDDIYVLMLKRYGQREMVSVRSDVDVSGFFKYFEKRGTSVLNGKEFAHYFVFKGSSEYDSREMSVLIDGVVSEAKELDIETLPPDEVARLKAMWEER